MTLHVDVLTTVPAFQATAATTDQEIVDELIGRSYDRLRAELLTGFVPINQILNAGKELGGATFYSPILTRLADTPGFAHWYETLGRDTSEVS